SLMPDTETPTPNNLRANHPRKFVSRFQDRLMNVLAALCRIAVWGNGYRQASNWPIARVEYRRGHCNWHVLFAPHVHRESSGPNPLEISTAGLRGESLTGHRLRRSRHYLRSFAVGKKGKNRQPTRGLPERT